VPLGGLPNDCICNAAVIYLYIILHRLPLKAEQANKQFLNRDSRIDMILMFIRGHAPSSRI
jgi:hypothetical protein